MATPAVRYFGSPAESGLRRPRALLAFGGWVDAASASTGAVRYLASALSARRLADVDPEDFYSFTDTRPLTSVVGPGQRAVHWPRGEFFGAPLAPASDRDLLLFVAPEPNLKWRTYAAVLLDVLQAFGTERLVSVGSIFGAVHHRAEVPLTGWATDSEVRQRLEHHGIAFPSYEGPTGFVTVLLAEAQARALPACALFAFAPNYVQGVPNPRVSHALLEVVASVLEVPLPLDELGRAGHALQRQIDGLLASQPELGEQVNRMLSLMGASTPSESPKDEPSRASEPEAPPRLPGQPVELPSPESAVREIEEFLRQLQRGEPGEGPGERPAPGQ